ncbi:uncharacterized protein LOC131162864 [Malania oleifera]|uniref:uncharacterized protein LOC131162864 n=1 Tax=Malania oleifera TaxID=397392 RepID=UPI0025ADEC40|nr:uncharacterized protein LOC131162864 [Malania oleifera]
MISDEAMKTWKFQRDLKKEIQRQTTILQLQDFATLVDKATVIEESLQEDAEVQVPKKRPAPLSSYSDKRHFEECRRSTEACFWCGNMGHRIRDCRMLRDDGASPQPYNGGATHSFLLRGFVKLCGLEGKQLDYKLVVATPSGSVVVCSKIVRDFPIEIHERVLPVSLIVFDMHGFDIILGMNWLSASYVNIDCHRREVVFRPPGKQEFKFLGSCVHSAPQILSGRQVRRLLLKGCQGYLALVKDTPEEERKLKGIPVVCEFPNMFLEDFSILPPDYEVEFVIELVLGTSPISKPPYCMAQEELRELKE